MGQPHQYYIEAMSHVELREAPREQFLRFIKSNPDVLFDLSARMLTRLGGILTRMEYLVFGNAYNKVASIISLCAQRFGEKKNGHVLIGVVLTHQDIANLIGIARETVSIEIKKLEKSGLIGYQGRYILVNNATALSQEAKLPEWAEL